MNRPRRLTLVCVGLVGLASSARLRAEQPSAAAPEQQSINRLISAALRDVHDRGAELYNKNDAAGCYRVLQGGLIAVRGLLSGRPELQQTIDEGLTNADSKALIPARAFALHDLIEDVRKQLRSGAKAEQPADKSKMPSEKPAAEEKETAGAKESPKQPADVKPSAAETPAIDANAPTLWGRLGGGPNVRKIVNDFVALAANDPKVDFTRGGKFPLNDEAVIHLKRELIDFVSQASGGPFHYTGKSMKEAHQGMGITSAQFDAAVADLKKALEKNGVRQADMDAVLAAVEGTRKDIVESDASK